MLLTNRFRLATVASVVAVVAALPLAVAGTTATAKSSICVALVVDASSLDGQVAADCATVADGGTGYDVLRAAGHSVGFRSDGIICTIDHRPSSGCATTDALHYWAYFHREPGSTKWDYSNEGATTYKPENKETEGWVWRDADQATPDNVPYSRICKATASPAPSASEHPSAATAPHRTTAAGPSTGASQDAAAAVTPTPTATPTDTRSAKPHHAQAATPAPVTPTPSATESTSVVADTQLPDKSSGPPYGLLAGVALAAGLGGVAAVRWRRRGGG